jgi:hypothetical protein
MYRAATKNVKIRNYNIQNKTTVLPGFCMGVKLGL